MKKRIISIFLTLCMMLCLVPTGVFAEGTGTGTDAGKAIRLGTGGISGYDSTDGYDYIYFGNWTSQDSYTTSGPIKWRVLDDQTNTGETGLFLLSDALLGTGQYGGVVFDNSGNNSNAWQNSTAKAWCKDFAGEAGAAENVPDAFTAAELAAILATTKSDGAYRSSTYNYNYSASENILNGDRVFFLSAEEAEKSSYGLTETSDRQAYHGTERGMWWLRSPYASNALNAGVVTYAGVVDQFLVTTDYAARPAFNLDGTAVLFTSAAAGGKADDAVDGSLTAVGDATAEWKLTLLDSGRSGFDVTTTAVSAAAGGTVSIAYSGAQTGANEYVSVLLVDSSNEVLYYGRIANNSESGTASVTIPAGLAAGTYTLKVFSEQCNGDYKTDYASNFVDVTLTVEAAAEIAIDAINFPDAKFRTVASGYDKDLSGTLSPKEIADVIWIDCAKQGIESMQGIEFFTALERLYCFKNSLTSLDVSRNTALKMLYCSDNSLTSLNIGSNAALKVLECYNNNLTSLNVSNNAALERLYCFKNSLTSLDVSRNTALKMLYCSDNSLTSLDVSSNTALEILGCNNNSLTTLNVNGAAALKELYCYENSLTSLDVSGATALELLHCFENTLTTLNVNGAAALKELYCYENSLTTLDVSSNTALETLYCYKNELTSLDASGVAALKELQCYENSLISLNVSGATALEKLDCSDNSLSALDVSSNTALENLQFCYNSLTALDISHNTALVTLNCGGNSLTALNISSNTALESLWCQENNLTVLDVSHNTALDMLCCWENNLTSLDVTGLTQMTGLWDFDAADNIYSIGAAMGDDRTFDLSTLPGFNVNKASNWNGGTVSGNTLTVNEGADKVTYTYDCGEGHTVTFTLNTVRDITSIEATVTEPEIGATPADTADVVTKPENGAVFDDIIWFKIAEEDFTGTDDDEWDEMAEGETFQPGYYYTPELYFSVKEGFRLAEAVTGKVNGREHDDTYGVVIDHEDYLYAYLSIVFEPLHIHEAGDEYLHDENSHWKECTECGAALTEKVAHTPDHEGHATEEYAIKCTVCGYVIEAQLSHTHSLTKVKAKSATCTEDGNIAYYTCDGCDNLFADATGSVEITADETVVEATGHDYQWVIDKEATATEAGSKHEECIVCHDKKAAVEISATGITPDYKIIDGANGAWKQNSDGTLTFRANGDFSNFVGVKVDGVLIDASNYTAVSGSTVITLKADYLQTLSVGAHTLTVVYPDGECSTNFEIKTSQSQDTGAASPQTGDNSHLALWIALLFVSGAGVAGTTVYSRKKKYSAK